MGLKFSYFGGCSGTSSMAAFPCSGFHLPGPTLPSSFSSSPHGDIFATNNILLPSSFLIDSSLCVLKREWFSHSFSDLAVREPIEFLDRKRMTE
jgi:hypothetical protein